MHGAYLKGEATVHSVKKTQAQGSATKTTTTASVSKARRLPNDEEATAIKLYSPRQARPGAK